MYSEGEEHYLKDLDWVNIVKSIRELKALTRVILSQKQRQLLAFEWESVLPCSKLLEIEESQFIQNIVPLQYDKSLKQIEYVVKVDKCMKELTIKTLSNTDIQILKEISNQDIKLAIDSIESHNITNKKFQTENEIRPKLNIK